MVLTSTIVLSTMLTSSTLLTSTTVLSSVSVQVNVRVAVCGYVLHVSVCPSSNMIGSYSPAMYSVEIRVERDRVTGQTRVLSTNTTLPVDLSHHGIKVYEDEQKGN